MNTSSLIVSRRGSLRLLGASAFAVGARDELFALLHRLMERGLAVLLISSDLPEVMGLSHRLALYRGGRIAREVASASADSEAVMAELTRAG